MATIKPIEGRSVHLIQSGQVIVDLCSVVKELVENSLDAGATSIEVRFKNNGLDLIEVVDNGGGIPPEDYESIALKHHTSKLATYSDLTTLTTFGFRGEALSSLCALSTFRITTAQATQAPKATKLEFEPSGKLKSTQLVAGQRGTTATVEDLFRRLPVRRRELEKNIKREYAKVLNLLQAYACVTTRVRIAVKSTMPKLGGRSALVFSTHANPTTRDNITQVYGPKTTAALIPLDLRLEYAPSLPARRAAGQAPGDTTKNAILVHGHVSRPVVGEGRQTPDRQMFFVNHRPCGLPQLARAFNEVYRAFNVSQAPFVFADLEMDTGAYDVNVSPDKRSILLHDAGRVVEELKGALVGVFEGAEQRVPISQAGVAQGTLGRQGGLGRAASVQGLQNAHAQAREVVPDPRRHRTLAGLEGAGQVGEESDGPGIFDKFKESSQPEEKEKEQEQEQEHTPEIPSQDSAAPEPKPDEQSGPSSGMTQYGFQPASRLLEPQPQTKPQSPDQQPNPQQPSHPSPRDPTPQIPSLSQSPLRHRPGPVENAFDRMRPTRPALQIAEVTVGGRTVQSVLDGFRQKRKAGDAGVVGGDRKGKRVGSTVGVGGAFGRFAAPGSQVGGFGGAGEEGGGGEEMVEEEEEEEEVEEGDEKMPDDEARDDTEQREDEEVSYEGPDDAGTDGEEQAEAMSQAESDPNYVDEEERKAQEEARVSSVIRRAEQMSRRPSEVSTARAQRMGSQTTPRKSIRSLESSVSSTFEDIEALVRSHESLSAASSCREQEALALDIEAKENLAAKERDAEAKLSLTVRKDDFANMFIVGQFNLGFILAVRPGRRDSSGQRSADELFIIDQHASDEKYNFERLQAETVVQNQPLVRPRTLDLTAVEEETIIDNLPMLEKNGFVVQVDTSGDEPIGSRCKLVSLPLSREVVFDTRDLEELVVLLSEAPSTHTLTAPAEATQSAISSYIPRPSKVRKMFAMRACRSSIMIGKTLTPTQMETVVRHMGTIDKPWNCPHGRPTMRHLMSLDRWCEWDEYKEVNNRSGVVPEAQGFSSACPPAVWKAYLERLRAEEEEE